MSRALDSTLVHPFALKLEYFGAAGDKAGGEWYLQKPLEHHMFLFSCRLRVQTYDRHTGHQVTSHD